MQAQQEMTIVYENMTSLIGEVKLKVELIETLEEEISELKAQMEGIRKENYTLKVENQAKDKQIKELDRKIVTINKENMDQKQSLVLQRQLNVQQSNEVIVLKDEIQNKVLELK